MFTNLYEILWSCDFYNSWPVTVVRLPIFRVKDRLTKVILSTTTKGALTIVHFYTIKGFSWSDGCYSTFVLFTRDMGVHSTQVGSSFVAVAVKPSTTHSLRQDCEGHRFTKRTPRWRWTEIGLRVRVTGRPSYRCGYVPWRLLLVFVHWRILYKQRSKAY